MSSNLTFAPIIVNPIGATTAERKLSVVNETQSPSVLLALVAEKGKLGAAVRQRLGNSGGVDIAKHAASGNYRPLAEYLSAKTGDVTIISSRAGFEALPDVFRAKELTARKAKGGGMKMGKDGVEVPGPKLALALEMLQVVESTIEYVADYHVARLAEKQAAEKQANEKQALETTGE
jgi:hypothetical protein